MQNASSILSASIASALPMSSSVVPFGRSPCMSTFATQFTSVDALPMSDSASSRSLKK